MVSVYELASFVPHTRIQTYKLCTGRIPIRLLVLDGDEQESQRQRVGVSTTTRESHDDDKRES